METTHVTPELLDAMIEQSLPPEVLSRLLWDHVRDLCPVCRTHLDQWLERHQARRVGFAGSALAAATGAARANAREATAAARDLEELLEAPEDERESRLEEDSSRFCSPLLVDLLIERVEERLHHDPGEAVRLARLAQAVAERVKAPGRLERQVRACVHLSNALRASSDYPAAEHAMRQARERLDDGGGVDPRVFAEVDRLEAVLLLDQKYLSEAEKLVSRAILVSRTFGDAIPLAKALLTRANARFHLGQRAEAELDLYRAAELADPAQDLRLACYARQHLVSFLCDSGDFRAAADLMAESRPLFRRFFATHDARKLALLIRWREGRIARGLEDFATAETALREAAEGYAELGVGYDAALAYLDLAETLLAQGKTDEVAHLAAAVEPLLKLNGLAEEALAALALFQNAATQRALTVGVVQRVRRRVVESREGGETARLLRRRQP